MSKTVVIGAGVIGLACAYALNKRGREVVVLDQGSPANICSLGNAGWIVPSLSAPLPAPGLTLKSLGWLLKKESPLYISPAALPRLAGWLWQFWRHCNRRDFEAGVAALASLNRETMRLFDSLAADGVRFEMHRSGLLFAFLAESTMRPVLREFLPLERYGYAMPRPLAADELHQLEPALSKAVVCGFLVEQERHVRPESLRTGLLQRLIERGVDIRSGVDVVAGQGEGHKLKSIRTSEDIFEGDLFVIAAGASSGRVASAFGVLLPVQAGKGYSITIEAGDVVINRPLYLGETLIGVTPFDGGVRFAGTMELSGINLRLDRQRITALQRGVSRFLPSFSNWNGATEWVGMRPVTPDGLPAIGRLPHYDNMYIATGHGTLGVTLAPATGELIADLIESGRTSDEAMAFDPGRFVA